MPEHTVAAGECITSIADDYGFFWRTLWNHPQNADLRSRREDPNVLLPGDVVFVPELRERWEDGDTENRHRFRKKGVPGVLRLRLLREPEPEEDEETEQAETTPYPPPDDVSEGDPAEETQETEDEPRADVDVLVEIDGRQTQTRTDSDGRLEISIPPGASSGRLVVEPGTENESVVPLELGRLNPVGTLSGVKQRLANLGFDPGDEAETQTPDLAGALREFQRRRGLTQTGEVDEETRQALKDAHED